MFIALPAAIEATSTAVKALIVIGVVTAFASICIYVGIRWEVSNTMEVQKRYDKTVNDYRSANEKLQSALVLENEKRKSDKGKADVEISHAIDGIVFYSDELRKSRQANRSGPLLPPALPGSKHPGLACFDRAEFDKADAIHRAEEASLTEEAFGLAESCSKRTTELDGVKKWAQSLPLGVVTFE